LQEGEVSEKYFSSHDVRIYGTSVMLWLISASEVSEDYCLLDALPFLLLESVSGRIASRVLRRRCPDPFGPLRPLLRRRRRAGTLRPRRRRLLEVAGGAFVVVGIVVGAFVGATVVAGASVGAFVGGTVGATVVVVGVSVGETMVVGADVGASSVGGAAGEPLFGSSSSPHKA